jgi:hypothetical protein
VFVHRTGSPETARNSEPETARISPKQRVKQPETVTETATETAKQSPRGKRNCFAPSRASRLTRGSGSVATLGLRSAARPLPPPERPMP